MAKDDCKGSWEALKNVWKIVKSQVKVKKKSENFEIENKWQPWVCSFRYRVFTGIGQIMVLGLLKKVREKSRECHNHKPQPFKDPKRNRKPTNLNKHKPNKRTKSTKISSLSSPSEVIAILKGLKNTRTKRHTERHTTNRLVE